MGQKMHFNLIANVLENRTIHFPVADGSNLKEIKTSITKEICHTDDHVADNENSDIIHKCKDIDRAVNPALS